MAFTVKSVDDNEQKSVQEQEAEFQKQHEEEQRLAAEAEAKAEAEAVDNEDNEGSDEPEEINEEKVLSFLKNKYNKELTSIDDLLTTTETEIPYEDVKTFLKYKKETGRGMEDFLKVNRDLDGVDEDSLLLEYNLSISPDLDKEDVIFEMENKYSFDEDFDDEKDVKRKKIAKKKELAKAKEYLAEQMEKYKVPFESSSNSIPEEDRLNYEAYKKQVEEQSKTSADMLSKQNHFTEKTEEFFGKFDGFEFGIDEGKKLTYKPGEANVIKEKQSSISNFINSFLDDKGMLKDAASYHRALAVASDPEGFAKFFYEQGKAEGVEGLVKDQKNIKMDTNQSQQQINKTGGVKVISHGDSGDSRLRIKVKNV